MRNRGWQQRPRSDRSYLQRMSDRAAATSAQLPIDHPWKSPLCHALYACAHLHPCRRGRSGRGARRTGHSRDSGLKSRRSSGARPLTGSAGGARVSRGDRVCASRSPVCWCRGPRTADRSGIVSVRLFSTDARRRGRTMRITTRWAVGVATLFLVGVLSGCAQSGSLRLVSAVGVAHGTGSARSGWSAPELIPAHELGTPALAHPPVFDAAGDAVVVWTEPRVSIMEAVTVEYLVRTSVRPVDGHWQPPETLSRLGLNPDVVFDAHGDTIAVWESPSGVQAAIRPAGGSWLAPQTVATPGGEEPQIAGDANGDVIAVSTRQASGHSTGIQAVLRPAGGTFSPAHTISGPNNDFYPRLAMNANGRCIGDVAARRRSGVLCGSCVSYRQRPMERPAGSVRSARRLPSRSAGSHRRSRGRRGGVVCPAWPLAIAGKCRSERKRSLVHSAHPGRGPAHRRNRGRRDGCTGRHDRRLARGDAQRRRVRDLGAHSPGRPRLGDGASDPARSRRASLARDGRARRCFGHVARQGRDRGGRTPGGRALAEAVHGVGA